MDRDTRGKNHQVSFTSCAACIIVQGEALARFHLAHFEGITVGQAACQNLLLSLTRCCLLGGAFSRPGRMMGKLGIRLLERLAEVAQRRRKGGSSVDGRQRRASESRSAGHSQTAQKFAMDLSSGFWCQRRLRSNLESIQGTRFVYVV